MAYYSKDDDNIERLFYQDSYGKKKVGRGIHNRASRKGYIKHFRMPSDYLSRKEKRQLNGKVKVYNMYDYLKDPKKVPNARQIKEMSLEEGKGVLTYLKKHYTSSKLQKMLVISSGSLYNLYDRFGVTYEKRTYTKKNVSGKEVVKKNSVQQELVITDTSDEENVKEEPKEENNIINDELINIIKSLSAQVQNLSKTDNDNSRGFTIKINDTLNKEDITSKLLGITEILSEDKEYEIDFILREKR